MGDRLAGEYAFLDELIGDRADEWDRTGRIPGGVLTAAGERGLLSAQIPARRGGLGLTSRENGELTAHLGSRCSSLRSVATSQGMAAWSIQRLAAPEQSAALLPELAGGRLAAVGFSEPDAGSDLAAMTTSARIDGDTVVLDGRKVWVTGAAYADLLLVVARFEDGAAALAVPASAPGVRVERVAEPLGCRAAGHADLYFDQVRLPASSVLGGAALPLQLLVTTALAYGRISVAWGCVGILRACRRAAAGHATTRRQFGRPIAEHQLVTRHLAELFVAEQAAARACEHASDQWDAGSPDQVVSTVLAKYVSSTHAAQGAATTVQVLASAGARDSRVAARAFRDAKLMEIIEGSNEICQLMLGQHVAATAGNLRGGPDA